MSNKANGNGNGTTPTTPAATTEDTILAALRKEYETTFKGKTTPKRQAELVGGFKRATADLEAAEKAVETAKHKASEAAKAVIREVSGTSRVTIGGVTYSPMSRGENVFFRKESAGTLDLG